MREGGGEFNLRKGLMQGCNFRVNKFLSKKTFIRKLSGKFGIDFCYQCCG